MIYLLTGEEEIDARNDEGIKQGKNWGKNHESMLEVMKKRIWHTYISFPRDILKCRASDHYDNEIEDPITCL